LSFYGRIGVGIGDLKIEESEVLCTDTTALLKITNLKLALNLSFILFGQRTMHFRIRDSPTETCGHFKLIKGTDMTL
jgi:hypothetical protein